MVVSLFKINACWRLLATTGFLLISPYVLGQTQPSLSLTEAEQLASQADFGRLGLEARARSLRELGVAESQWPDPSLRFGAMAVPTDTFDLDQENMTRLELGYSQQLPRGDSLGLTAGEYTARASADAARAADQAARTRLEVRRAWSDTLHAERRQQLLQQTAALIEQWIGVAEDAVASSRGGASEVSLAKLQLLQSLDELIATQGEEGAARARLARWLGPDARRPLPDQWPDLPALPEFLPVGPAELLDKSNHPQITAAQQELVAADQAVSLARQAFKPAWTVDLTYGARSGTTMDGSSRPDLFSAMLMVKLPLFPDQRQNRKLAASQALWDQALARRDERLQQLFAQQQEWQARLEQARQRLSLIEQKALSEASNAIQAAEDGWASGETTLDRVLLAELTRQRLLLAQLDARRDAWQAQAHLHYLLGEPS